MAIALNTAGISIKYAVETTAGTRPTTGFTAIDGVKSISDLNPEPNLHDATTLAETEYKAYIEGLKDLSNPVTLTANNTNAFQTAWSSLTTAAETAASSDKETWFEIQIPGLTNSFYFAGKPIPLGLSAIEVDSVLEISSYIVPHKVASWAAKST